jgi:transcriptional regulator with XRE-family HTH domain
VQQSELYGQCKDLARLGVAQFASSKLAQRYGSRIAARGLARASPPPFPTLAVGHERVACNGALSVIALNIRTILRGLMVLKLLACADEGAGTRRVESQATSGSARPSQENLAVDAGIDRTYVSRLERGLENPTITVLEQLAEALDAGIRRVLRRPGCGRASAEASARWSTTETIEGATQGNYAKQLWVFARGVRHQSAPPPPRKAALAG